jgi:small subunit ribosomal protein S11
MSKEETENNIEASLREKIADKPIEQEMKIIREGKESKSAHGKSRAAIAHIFTSFNNTIVHITDVAGNTISRISGGMVTKHDRLKANPTVAMFVAKRAAEKAKEFGITDLYIRVKAKTGNTSPGPGAHSAIKSLSKEGFKILSIEDVTKIPRGGPKAKGGRRGRRV